MAKDENDRSFSKLRKQKIQFGARVSYEDALFLYDLAQEYKRSPTSITSELVTQAIQSVRENKGMLKE